MSVVTLSGLGWQGLRAAHFLGLQLHDVEALTAYGAYRRSLDEPPAERAAEADRSAGNSNALQVSEDEGGPVSLWEARAV